MTGPSWLLEYAGPWPMHKPAPLPIGQSCPVASIVNYQLQQLRSSIGGPVKKIEAETAIVDMHTNNEVTTAKYCSSYTQLKHRQHCCQKNNTDSLKTELAGVYTYREIEENDKKRSSRLRYTPVVIGEVPDNIFPNCRQF